MNPQRRYGRNPESKLCHIYPKSDKVWKTLCGRNAERMIEEWNIKKRCAICILALCKELKSNVGRK